MIPLPRYVFISGPKHSGKTTLSQLLVEQNPESACIVSIAEPLRMACLSVFNPDEMMLGLDLTDPAVKQRSLPVQLHPPSSVTQTLTYRWWLVEFGKWLRHVHGNEILATLAKRRCDGLHRFYRTFVIPDNRFKFEYQPFLSEGVENILHIEVVRPAHHWTDDDVGEDINTPYGVRTITVPNASHPAAMLDVLRERLGLPQETSPPDLHSI